MNETQEQNPLEDVEFMKGCPLCAHSDPELEQVVEEFARWLYEVMLADAKKKRESGNTRVVDNPP